MSRDLGLIVKATRYCNLRCSYCHDWRVGREQRMGFEVLARMTASALRGSGARSVEFIWHGGEPTVLPMAFYERALYLQARCRLPGQAIRNSLQTNGTRLDRQWARFLSRNEISVSISLDGPPVLQDRQRRYASGRASSDDVLRGMRILREHDVPFGVLAVVDDDTLELGADALFDFFVEHEIHSFGLLAATPVNTPDAAPGTPIDHYVDPVQMTAFLIEVYDLWAEHGDRRIQIRELEAVRSRLQRGRAGVCTLAGGCLGHYYAVEPNGDIAHCDVFVGDDAYTLGNVRDRGFAQIARSRELRELRRENTAALDAMRTCPEFAVCKGWCPHERYLSERHHTGHRADCCGLRPLIEHVRAGERARRPVAA